jgi:DNA-directed RNA polymerase specialized sigma24 family protein
MALPSAGAAPPPQAGARSGRGFSPPAGLLAELAHAAFQASSLNAPPAAGAGSASLADCLGEEDPRLELALDMQAVWTHLPELPEREQRMLMLRFYGNMSQSQIADKLGLSQMHVSRLLSHALAHLRECITGPEPPGAAPSISDGGAPSGQSRPGSC